MAAGAEISQSRVKKFRSFSSGESRKSDTGPQKRCYRSSHLSDTYNLVAPVSGVDSSGSGRRISDTTPTCRVVSLSHDDSGGTFRECGGLLRPRRSVASNRLTKQSLVRFTRIGTMKWNQEYVAIESRLDGPEFRVNAQCTSRDLGDHPDERFWRQVFSILRQK